MNYYIEKGMFEKMSKYWKNHFEHIFCITFRRRGPHPKRSLPLPQAARNKPRYRPSLPRNRQYVRPRILLLARTCWSILSYLFIATSTIYCVNYQDIKCCIVRHRILLLSYNYWSILSYLYIATSRIYCVWTKSLKLFVTIKEVVMSYYFNIQTNDSLYFKLC